QLILITPSAANPGQYAILAREAVDGLVARADNFVLRLDDGQSVDVDFYAYQWGKPLPNANVTISIDPPTPDTPVGPQNPISELYGNNYPAEGLTFNGTFQTNAEGKAQMRLTGNAIHSPRVYIDGQIYTLTYQSDTVDPAFGPEQLVVHLRDYFEEIAEPVWEDISEMMIQYSNLYPIMSKYVVDLADPAALAEKRNILIFAFSRDINDTMHMPVTRDLSDTKRKTILNWLKNPRTGPKAVLKSQARLARAENPVAPGTELTERQIRYREAVQAKNGSFTGFTATENLFENL
ncbi:MAG: hypothetical protein ACO1N1_01070, partial [Dyadobacter fermentans]